MQPREEPKSGKMVIGFHEANLPESKEREERRAHFRAALDMLEELAEVVEGVEDRGMSPG